MIFCSENVLFFIKRFQLKYHMPAGSGVKSKTALLVSNGFHIKYHLANNMHILLYFRNKRSTSHIQSKNVMAWIRIKFGQTWL